jgi:hypothetical protein
LKNKTSITNDLPWSGPRLVGAVHSLTAAGTWNSARVLLDADRFFRNRDSANDD